MPVERYIYIYIYIYETIIRFRSPGEASGGPALFARCRSGKLEAWIHLPVWLGFGNECSKVGAG